MGPVRRMEDVVESMKIKSGGKRGVEEIHSSINYIAASAVPTKLSFERGLSTKLELVLQELQLEDQSYKATMSGTRIALDFVQHSYLDIYIYYTHIYIILILKENFTLVPSAECVSLIVTITLKTGQDPSFSISADNKSMMT